MTLNCQLYLTYFDSMKDIYVIDCDLLLDVVVFLYSNVVKKGDGGIGDTPVLPHHLYATSNIGLVSYGPALIRLNCFLTWSMMPCL